MTLIRRHAANSTVTMVMELSRDWVDDGHCRATVIHEQLFPGAMPLPHAALLAELGIAVTKLNKRVRKDSGNPEK